MIRLKRVCAEPSEQAGLRILVEHLWPRGRSKQQAAVDLWQRDRSPSTELRRWCGYDPYKWSEIRRRNWSERGTQDNQLELLQAPTTEGDATFVFAASDVEQNSVVALKEYLEKKL